MSLSGGVPPLPARRFVHSGAADARISFELHRLTPTCSYGQHDRGPEQLTHWLNLRRDRHGCGPERAHSGEAP
eukprot:4437228-Alexandrium_andersonii.AAC.1